ncbi:cysteinyl-tRNA synthetase [Constrictibacter sp. MBR-5]|uniref:cysteine--tRNA ligase n=1 Tax=Constrictibacter sp. MBR-5 TaxID=3156467 RepID=UPI003397C20B
MALVLHNTLTRVKETFEPIDPQHVRMYVCGPTVYDFAHIGNARPVVVFDVLYRLLQRRYPRVTYVRNITDVDDKINAAARESGRTIREITEGTAKAFHEDMAALGALEPDVEPRATEHIAQMVAMIGKLIEGGHAYAAEGHVLFNVPSMPDYGRLSRRNRDDMVAGARVEVAPYKRDPADFILWKPSDAETPGWDSPWGRGRPGWHIECSAMSEAYLGETFDIHGGGADLIFPHHENEVAQSVCAHGGKPFVRYWVHNGWVMVEGEKMSKSLGNFFTVRDLLGEHPGEAIRLTLLSAHYRQPLDFTKDLLAQSKQALDRFYLALRDQPEAEADPALLAPIEAALDDDLNTPAAIAALHDLTTRLNKARDHEKPGLAAALRAAGGLLGLLDADPERWLRGEGTATAGGPTPEEIEDLIVRRRDARKAKDFAEADRIRDSLAAQGVLLEDSPQGTTWRRS